MTAGRRRSAAVSAVFALAVVGAAGTAPAASQGAQGACPDDRGVTVVVDPQELGGGVLVRCAPGPVDTGLQALDGAGIAYRTALRSPGFVCRIADQPSSDPCVTTSPATAYWAYWIATRGGSWCYANLGAGNRTPPPGTVEGWSFAKDRTGAAVPPPRLPPPPPAPGAARSTIPVGQCSGGSPSTPPPAPPPTSAPVAPDPGRASAVPPVTEPSPPAPGSTSPAPRRGPAPAPEPTVAGASEARDAAEAGDEPEPVPLADQAAADAGAGEDGGSPPVGTLAGIVLVLGVVGGAVGVARHRRTRVEA